MTTEIVSRLVESADLKSLLPSRQRGQMTAGGPLKILDSMALSPGSFIAVVEGSFGEIFEFPLLVEDGTIRRALPGDGVAELLLKQEVGRENFLLTRWHSEPAQGERAIGVDQTEESVIVGDHAILKWFTKPTLSAKSCLPRIEALQKAGFTAMPAPWLSLEWRRDQRSEPILLAYASSYIAEAQDGWTWATADLQAFLDRHTSLEESTSFASVTGKLIGRMHTALVPIDSRCATEIDIKSWISTALNDLWEAATVTTGPEGERLRNREPRIRELLEHLKIDSRPRLGLIHGDLHVGQILRSADGVYSIIDFDGNPVESEDSLIDRQPTTRDLAGILQSIDHVGRVIEKRVGYQFPTEIQLWIATAQRKFRAAYAETLGDGGQEVEDALLLLFQVQQECREFLYAHRHLQHWIYVPDRALPALIEGI